MARGTVAVEDVERVQHHVGGAWRWARSGFPARCSAPSGLPVQAALERGVFPPLESARCLRLAHFWGTSTGHLCCPCPSFSSLPDDLLVPISTGRRRDLICALPRRPPSSCPAAMQHLNPVKQASDYDIPGIYTSENVSLDVPAVGQDGRPPPVKYTFARPCSPCPASAKHPRSLPTYHSPLRHHKRAASSTRRVKVRAASPCRGES